MKCPHCKSDIPDGATVCAHCGAYSQTQTQLGYLGCLTLPLAVVAGAAVGLVLAFVVLGVLNQVGLQGLVPLIFPIGLIVFPPVGALVAVKLLPGKKEKIWIHKR